MKNLIALTGLILLLAIFFGSCGNKKEEYGPKNITYRKYLYVDKTADAIREVGIKITAPRTVLTPEKMLVSGQFILLKSGIEGFYIIDNTDPVNPVNAGFLELEGCFDAIVKDGILYASNYIDLVAVDISDPLQSVLVKRVADVFVDFYKLMDNGYRIGIKDVNFEVELTFEDDKYGRESFETEGGFFARNNGGTHAVSGIIGRARFGLGGEYLYALSDSLFSIFDVGDANNPIKKNTVAVSWKRMEKVYGYGDYLFIDADDSVFVFDNSQPESPVLLSPYEAFRSGDPVFFQNDFAYVSSDEGSSQYALPDKLNIFDVSDMINPRLLRAYGMKNLHKTTVAENTLYICDGSDGLKVYDVTDPGVLVPIRLDYIADVKPYDVIAIPSRQLLIVRCEDGLCQYNTEDKRNLEELSVFPIVEVY